MMDMKELIKSSIKKLENSVSYEKIAGRKVLKVSRVRIVKKKKLNTMVVRATIEFNPSHNRLYWGELSNKMKVEYPLSLITAFINKYLRESSFLSTKNKLYYNIPSRTFYYKEILLW